MASFSNFTYILLPSPQLVEIMFSSRLFVFDQNTKSYW